MQFLANLKGDVAEEEMTNALAGIMKKYHITNLELREVFESGKDAALEKLEEFLHEEKEIPVKRGDSGLPQISFINNVSGLVVEPRQAVSPTGRLKGIPESNQTEQIVQQKLHVQAIPHGKEENSRVLNLEKDILIEDTNFQMVPDANMVINNVRISPPRQEKHLLHGRRPT
eukprot:TRINITY_DN2299_c0_g1_i1.p1 TRINITY_DN2299_c0_g1~~TRINITY_DN2299_c0_g1_i1.p1  ORF type:complete len:172 (-),score=47.50 TRINITY_DN2299_c0_g1_i1:37-552(-)